MPFSEAGFVDVVESSFRHEQAVDLDGAIGRARSTSYLPGEGAELDRMVARIREIHARYADDGGVARFVYRTALRMATRA